MLPRKISSHNHTFSDHISVAVGIYDQSPEKNKTQNWQLRFSSTDAMTKTSETANFNACRLGSFSDLWKESKSTIQVQSLPPR